MNVYSYSTDILNHQSKLTQTPIRKPAGHSDRRDPAEAPEAGAFRGQLEAVVGSGQFSARNHRYANLSVGRVILKELKGLTSQRKLDSVKL
jgi:hypothetical protein